MVAMKFVYFYSPTFQFYHEHLQSVLAPYFSLIPILIEDLPVVHIPFLTKGHHFDGLAIKMQLVFTQILNHMNESIVFSDATIFINKGTARYLLSFFQRYNGYDLTLIKESTNTHNIGVLRITCNKRTLQFFKTVLDIMKLKNNRRISHDQAAVNYLLPLSELNFTLFDDGVIYCGSNFNA